MGIADVEVPHDYCSVTGCRWTILTQLELPKGAAADPHAPLIGRGILTARYGLRALSEVPALRLGPLYTVDRADIESMRTLDNLIREYEAVKVQKKPLCIGVFGPPGAGKSFAVKALAEAILGKNVPFPEFNLSQFSDPSQLIGAFHRVRDEVLKGITPVVFWDEFDSLEYFWLQYLLAPMQDGTFQQGEITHPLGKCIFVFAGGTADTCETFGVPPPPPRVVQAPDGIAAEGTAPVETAREKMAPEEAAEIRRQQEKAAEAYRQFQLRKGPDFVSRLHGFLNVLGPNERKGTTCVDNSWPIRRALQMRGMLRLEDDDELDIDPGLLYALLSVPEYKFGVRSLERIVNAMAGGGSQAHINRSDLPPRALLDRETAADKFLALVTQRDAFRLNVNVDALAQVINWKFCDEFGGERDFDKLPTDVKASNRAAARRIPDHLALINFVAMPASPGDTSDWRGLLEETIEHHIQRLAEAEHLGWCSERMANGWTYAPVRDNARKKHPLLVPWKEVPDAQKDKDREIVRWIPGILDMAKHKAVPANA